MASFSGPPALPPPAPSSNAGSSGAPDIADSSAGGAAGRGGLLMTSALRSITESVRGSLSLATGSWRSNSFAANGEVKKVQFPVVRRSFDASIEVSATAARCCWRRSRGTAAALLSTARWDHVAS